MFLGWREYPAAHHLPRPGLGDAQDLLAEAPSCESNLGQFLPHSGSPTPQSTAAVPWCDTRSSVLDCNNGISAITYLNMTDSLSCPSSPEFVTLPSLRPSVPRCGRPCNRPLVTRQSLPFNSRLHGVTKKRHNFLPNHYNCLIGRMSAISGILRASDESDLRDAGLSPAQPPLAFPPCHVAR